MSSQESREDNYPLPIISEETAATVVADIEEYGQAEYIHRAIDKFMKENPVAFTALGGQIRGDFGVDRTEAEITLALVASALLHDMFVRQAEASRLDELFLAE